MTNPIPIVRLLWGSSFERHFDLMSAISADFREVFAVPFIFARVCYLISVSPIISKNGEYSGPVETRIHDFPDCSELTCDAIAAGFRYHTEYFMGL
jgi:hypothetical protein